MEDISNKYVAAFSPHPKSIGAFFTPVRSTNLFFAPDRLSSPFRLNALEADLLLHVHFVLLPATSPPSLLALQALPKRPVQHRAEEVHAILCAWECDDWDLDVLLVRFFLFRLASISLALFPRPSIFF